MKQRLIKPALLGCLAVCAAFVIISFERRDRDQPLSAVPYQWSRLTDNANFSKSYNFQLFNQGGKLWAFHPDGNYYSADGKEWIKSSLPNSINNLAFMNYIQFNNAILGLGRFEGNIENFKLSTSITQTTDLKTWKILSEKSNLPRRFFYDPIVFNNKIWIFGGTDDGERNFDDAWSSSDGVHWTQEVEHLPFGARSRENFLVFKNKLYLLGNDVWESTDGINWKLLTPQITDVELVGYTPIVFDEKIWLLGCNRNRQFSSEVLVSGDGINWEKQDAPWSPRGGIAATVFQDKLYITGGKYGGFREGSAETEFIYSNDVWVLEKK